MRTYHCWVIGSYKIYDKDNSLFVELGLLLFYLILNIIFMQMEGLQLLCLCPFCMRFLALEDPKTVKIVSATTYQKKVSPNRVF